VSTGSHSRQRDLEEIEAYIARDNPVAAENVIDDIEAACQLVADHPGVGRRRDEIEHRVMSFPVGSYLIYYRAEEGEPVGIARIIHSRRDAGPAFYDL
jgi:toxin ParE1/3/4